MFALLSNSLAKIYHKYTKIKNDEMHVIHYSDQAMPTHIKHCSYSWVHLSLAIKIATFYFNYFNSFMPFFVAQRLLR